MIAGFVVAAAEFGVVVHPTFWIFFPLATRRYISGIGCNVSSSVPCGVFFPTFLSNYVRYFQLFY